YKKNADLADQTRQEIEELGGTAITVAADVEEPEEITRLFEAGAAEFGKLDFFVNNAAASSFKNIADLKQHQLDPPYAMNVRSFVLGAQHAVALMPAGGRIVALSSYGSIRAYPTYANLGSAKAAIEAWVRYMAVEFGARGINVNAVNGGIIETASSEDFYNVPGMAPLPPGRPRLPKGRLGPAQGCADVAAFRRPPAAEYITGQSIVVDGGLAVVAPPFLNEMSSPLI